MKTISLVMLATSAFFLAACEDQYAADNQNIDVPFGIEFDQDERRIWSNLNDEQRARAITFIANGGTLIASLGDK